jgi:hypothetical protein
MEKIFWVCLFWIPLTLNAQEYIPLEDLSFFKSTGKTNWKLAKDASADLSKKDVFTLTPGTGVLVNLPSEGNMSNLHSAKDYGDVDISFDFMMSAHSNSGFYLQGRYEVQLLDSWGVLNPTTADCGGIYQRFKQGPPLVTYEGYAPRVNACLAPGLWQHIDISFQAPRFDSNGKKISDAKMIQIKLNGAIIHENVSLRGPTGGSISEMETEKGPFVIQGDHGSVAFRHFSVKDLSDKPAYLDPVNYQVYLGEFKGREELSAKKPEVTATKDKLTWDLTSNTSQFANSIKTMLNIPTAGEHSIEFEIKGKYFIQINGKEVYAEPKEENNNRRTLLLNLPSGKVPFEIIQIKTDKRVNNSLGFWISGPNFRNTALHGTGSYLSTSTSEEISLDANTSRVFRSFMDVMKNGKRIKRVVHAVNVGSPDKLHYTFDLDNANIVQIWKGNFLNTTPMWDDRGDGSSRPLGAVLTLSPNAFFTSKSSVFSQDNLGENLLIKGYELDNEDIPTFNYMLDGADILDKTVMVNKKHFQRTLTIKNPNPNHVCRLAVGSDIIKTGENRYLIDGKAYYIEVAGATIETGDNQKALVIPASDKVQYSIIW